MFHKISENTHHLENRLSCLEEKLDHILNNTVESPQLNSYRQENSKLKYRLQILTKSTEDMHSVASSSNQTPAVPKPNSGVDFSETSFLSCLKSWFREAISRAYPDLKQYNLLVTPATKEAFGDYQLNSAMSIAQTLAKDGMKTNPRSVAEAIRSNLTDNKFVEKTEIAGPGFINVHLKRTGIAQNVFALFVNGVTPPKLSRRLRVIVDFSSPNIAKEMHVGHLRSTIIGDCISRLTEWVGHDVLRLNHLGDWGTQFGMLIANLLDKYPDIAKHPDRVPPITDLMTLYKESKQRFDNEPDFNVRARECVVKLQMYEDGVYNVWKAICDTSRQEFNRIYELLDVTITERGESFYQPLMVELVDHLRSIDRLKKEDGREVLFASGVDVPLTIVKSDGGYTYGTSDMATMRQRVHDEKADWIIYVVDAGQALHLNTVYAASREVGSYDPAKVRVDHVAFGVVLGEGKKKLKTREGDTVKLSSLIDEGLKRCDAKLREKDRQSVLNDEEFKAAQQSVAIGCIKYADLSHNRTNDYVFSFDRMLDDKGNTAAYLLYAYTRIRSIARNAGVDRDTMRKSVEANGALSLEHAKEFKLAKEILKFYDALAQMIEELMPNVLCDYLYDLASVFTEFYDVCYCIEKDSDGNIKQIHHHRLLLSEVTADVMAVCFHILGLKPVNKM